jgi:hypothetical protein
MAATKLSAILAAILAVHTVKLVNIQVMVLKDLKPEMYHRF